MVSGATVEESGGTGWNYLSDTLLERSWKLYTIKMFDIHTVRLSSKHGDQRRATFTDPCFTPVQSIL
jgi:hypothetical protein